LGLISSKFNTYRLIGIKEKNMKTNLKEILFSGIFYFVIAVIFTWPLAAHFTKAIPSGSEPAAVAYFQFFTARWTGMAMEGKVSYWNAPFFYPFHGAFAWCEPQLLTTLIIWLFSRLLGYVAAYNLIVLAYMSLMGMAGYALTRLLTKDKIAALFSGTWLCAGAFALQQICSLPMLAAGFVFFTLIFMLFYLRYPRWKYFLCWVVSYLAVWLTCKQSAGFLTILMPCLLWPWMGSFKKAGKVVLVCLGVMVIAALVMFSYVSKQLMLTQSMGFERSLSQVKVVLNARELITPAAGHWLSSRILGIQTYSWDIGLTMLLVILIALFKGCFRNQEQDGQRRKILAGLWTLFFCALLLGFGPQFFGYSYLFKHLPGLNFVRAPSRSAMLVIFAISGISGWALARVRERLSIGLKARLVSVGLFLVLFAEIWTMPIPLVFPGKEVIEHQAAIDWLRNNDLYGPLVELPLKKGSRDMEAAAMLRMLEHKHPLINGYASYSPVAYLQLKQALLNDQASIGSRYLSAYGCRYILVHKHLLSPNELLTLISVPGRKIVFEEKDHLILGISEIPTILKDNDLFPGQTTFSKIVPAVGKTYALSLLEPCTKPRLMNLSGGRDMMLTWDDAQGNRYKIKMVLKGTLLLDQGQQKTRFTLTNLSRTRAQGILENGQ